MLAENLLHRCPAVIAIRSDTLRCEIVPDLGGAISGLWFQDTPVLRSGPASDLQSPRQAASFALLPFSNRIGHGSLQWSGQTYPLCATPADQPHAIHGVGWQHAWEVSMLDEQGVTLVYTHPGDGFWPFPFVATQRIGLEADRLLLSLQLRNTCAAVVPAGFGWHPYFVKRSRSRISLETQGRWAAGADKLPSHWLSCDGLQGACEALSVDNCFDGWNGVAEIRDELICARITSNLKCLVVYTHPGLDFVAIEPVSHVNNALQLSGQLHMDAELLGLRSLAPGESIHAQAVIQVASTINS